MGWETSCAYALSCVRVIPGGGVGRILLGAGVSMWLSVVVCVCWGGGGLCACGKKCMQITGRLAWCRVCLCFEREWGWGGGSLLVCVCVCGSMK